MPLSSHSLHWFVYSEHTLHKPSSIKLSPYKQKHSPDSLNMNLFSQTEQMEVSSAHFKQF